MTSNGTKQFIYVIVHQQYIDDFPRTHLDDDDDSPGTHLVRSDHDPEPKELAAALSLNYDPDNDDIVAIRFDEDEIIELPPKA
jgi:hypothetical protein